MWGIWEVTMTKVLIVDDASFMRISIRSMLEKDGFEVVGEAADGLEAISKYKILQPDVVTMDITMPNMTGIEAVKGILEFDAKAKILMVSALGQEKFVRQSILAGAKSFIVKPFKSEELLDAITKIASM